MSDASASHGVRGVCRVAGLLLAAGAGRRAGGPKALRTDGVRGARQDATWAERGAEVLLTGGCDQVTVVVGAASEAVAERLADWPVQVVEAADWAQGLGSSLRAGLVALMVRADVAADHGGPDESPCCACVHLVDLPDVGADVVARLLPRATPDALVRASYAGRVGHPVLIGRNHWAGVCETVDGDRGAGAYLRSHGAQLVECADLATGADVDSPPAPKTGPG
ncbi:nucleotidyltransferase family protein [Segeticoccus rhizosphaerae]|uniref:nucleotidyltransferase family protein n=1 Tax=Segeticoccus rhizosphaerae TaxID=1104777 RepID=UPI001EE4530C|nr:MULTISPECIES: NTP transferase domain-containing protein [Intrasporangiaceae]